MAIENIIKPILTSDTDVSAITSSVFYIQAPQTADKPYIVFSVRAGEPVTHQTGASGLKRLLIQIDLYATDSSQLINLRDAVVQAMLSAQRTTVSSIEIRQIVNQNDIDIVGSPQSGQGLGEITKSLDFEIYATTSTS